jgi:hypothetical protein
MVQNGEITDTAPLWWEIQNIPTEVVRELRRRSNTNNIGMNIPTPFTNTTFDFENNFKNYKGPMSPWVRVFSNGTGKSINGMVPRSDYLDKFYVPVDYDGFILKGGDGFFDAFGYDAAIGFKQTNAIIGYQADGRPHYIDGLYRTQTSYSTRQNAAFPQNNEIASVVPPPGIISVSVKQSKDLLTYASFKFKCYGVAQLEYLTPFFFTAGINVFLEFGWNLFNQKSLLNLADLKQCWEVVYKPQTALDRANKSNGNYGCVSGIISKYSFTTTDGFTYDCNVDLISRQGMFAGMRTDNSVKISTTDNKVADQNDIEFLDLRTFIKNYLPSINQVIIDKVNFLKYIQDKIGVFKEDKSQKDANANAQTLANPASRGQQTTNLDPNRSGTRAAAAAAVGPRVTTPLNPNIPAPPSRADAASAAAASLSVNSNKINVNNVIKNNKTLFYGGKSEDRVFVGRSEEYYRLKKKPDGKSDVINYGSVKPDKQTYTQLSFVDDTTDFDSKDGASEVWMQLDFVFELANLFMANANTKQFLIDISDVVISAHPNLISCDKNVLIPNPVSPKINRGSPYKQGNSNSGFLKNDNQSPDGNSFLSQLQDITVPRNTLLEARYKKAVDSGDLVDFYHSLTPEDSFYFASNAAKKAFKTSGRYRDNLDVIINYLYYHSANFKGNTASFPFAEDMTIIRKNTFGQPNKIVYKKYYYGYLKHIYISKTKLIEIVQSNETKNYKQFINAILNTVNESVDDFWKFDIVEGKDENGKSILSIIDKNTSNFDELRKVYMFELGRTNNVVKSINFDVSLTNEQAIQVQFGGQNSENLKTKLTEQITNIQNKDQLNATLNDLKNLPFLRFVDRMDKFQLGLMISQQSGSIAAANTLVPGATSGIEDDNTAIADLQSYGSKEKSGVLCITTKQVSENYVGGYKSGPESVKFKELVDDTRNLKNHKFLCLPSDMKGKLTQMLNDNDFKNNGAKYSGVADNFAVTIKFDGIFSFRNMQVFAISNLPKPYVPGNIIFQILEVDHEISNGKWETSVNALVRCIGGSKLEYFIV